MVGLLVVGTAAQQGPAVLLPGQSEPSAPPVSVSTYGGSGRDVVNAAAVDGNGYIYLAGYTNSKDLPALDRAFRREPHDTDAFVAKIDPAGRPAWSTYLGGNDARSHYRNTVGDNAQAIAVDSQGNVYVAGSTTSTDFPTENARFPLPVASARPSADGFVAKLSPNGDRLLFSTYLGGADGSSGVVDMATGPTGEVWLAIATSARQFWTTHDLSDGAGRFVVMKLTSGGSPQWSTRLGSRNDEVRAIAVDAAGQVHLTGHTVQNPCSAFPAPDCQTAAHAFVGKLDATGSRRLYQAVVGGTRSPFLNGVPNTQGMDVTIAADGSAVVVGTTTATDLPIRNAWQDTFGGASDVFVARFTPAGTLTMSSYLGGNGGDAPDVVRAASDMHGRIHIAFGTTSTDLPTRAALVPRHVDGPVFTSADRGARWQWASTGVAGGAADLALDAERNLVYVATGHGIFRTADNGAMQSRDGGATWSHVSAGLLSVAHRRAWWCTRAIRNDSTPRA